MKKLLQLRALEIIAFTSGFALMAFELAAARVLAPYIGSSTYVWTSVIGVIIASLSLGYYAGGLLADKHHRLADVAWLCLASAVAVTLAILLYQPVLQWIAEAIIDPRAQGVVASLLLFAPTSFLIGIKAPYLAKLKVTSLERTGQSVASLSALNAVGGIVGVFVAGFILFSYIGSRETLATIMVLLVASSWLVVPRRRFGMRLAISLAVIAAGILPYATPGSINIDTPTAHYQIREGSIEGRAHKVRALITGPGGAQSGTYADGRGGLAFWYTKEMAQVVEKLPKKSRILMLGGGTFTLPSYLAKRYPHSTIDVVEIDPVLKNIASQYFGFRPLPNLNLLFKDARSYVNTTKETYDIILVDVYSELNVPFSLMTREYGEKVAALLTPRGALVANIIAATAGPCRPIFNAVSAAYQVNLPRASYKTYPGTLPERRANMITIYTRYAVGLKGYTPFTGSQADPYTDNFMPAERLQQMCRESAD